MAGAALALARRQHPHVSFQVLQPDLLLGEGVFDANITHKYLWTLLQRFQTSTAMARQEQVMHL